SSSQTNYPGSFFNDSYEVYGADWTPELLNEFEQRKAYRLQDYFTQLLSDGHTDTSARIISDYREVVGELLRENFTEQWTRRANEKGVTTRNQAHGSPANLIDIYASVDIPECESFGITDFDIPLLRKDSIRKENDGDPTALKFASSAAHITGKKYTSAETFTWLTEHFRTSLSQCKPEIDQMFVSGVNHVYFHGTAYSPDDAAWPGWKFYASVDMSPANTIWRDAPAFFRYIARVQSFLQYGTPDNDFLLYLPMHDIWHEQRGNYFQTFPIHGMREKLPDFYETVSHIKKNGYDVDYISDRYIQTAATQHGMIQTSGGTEYKALIIPSVKQMPLQTLEKIIDLAKGGATILFTGQYPSDVPGFSRLTERRDSLANILAQLPEAHTFGEAGIHRFGKGIILTGSDYKDLFDHCQAEPEPFKTHFGGEYIRRTHKEGYHYFFTLLQDREVDGWAPLAVKATSAMLFDPATGKSGKAQIRKGKQTEVYLQLKPGESIILKTFSRKHTDAPEWTYYKESGTAFALADNWKMSFVESSPPIKGAFNLPALGSWTALGDDSLTVNKGTARYQTSFRLDKKNKGSEYRLCLGDVRESARVYVNGEWVATLFSVPFHVNIGAYLKEGENRIEIEVTNLPANRIADYDRRGIHWRKFYDINFVNIRYDDARFDTWAPIPSGLLGPVVLKELTPLLYK
ncbi:MAG: glycosyl hydrolase family 2, partial [Tannerellaceae bacterium]|nr:glycosyl hydrolase family 2 [Tannerellaceae bacterium]